MRRLALLLLLLAGTPAAAQETAFLPLLPTLPASTRALGLGGAFAIGSTDSDALFYNPAFGDRLRGASLGVQWAGSETTLYTLSAATDWWGGAVALGVLAVDYPTAAPFDSTVLALWAPGSTSERAALLGYSRKLLGVPLAITGRLLELRALGERNATAAVDFATGMQLGFVTLGLSVQNLGPGINVADRAYDLPLRATLNAGSVRAAPVGPIDLGAAAQLAWTRHGELVPAGGLELSYWPVNGRTFFLRAGGRRATAGAKPYTLGAGFSGDKLIIDYAWAPEDGGNMHRVGVRWR
ncbi:MAG: hypothetical protein FIB01_14725 [Gemmatimonadetes bacterium]|nr:hypothetical protein [Gemmatimonadota bacterium]